jgi:hypothetical protein
MASGGLESAQETAQTATVVVERWIVHSSSSVVSEPCLEL